VNQRINLPLYKPLKNNILNTEMEYNTGRNKLVIPEYGRHIQKLIEYATTVEDEKERHKLANAIVDVMGQLNPHLRDITDFKHKLWDHLFIISDFKLDVESPYDIPDKQSFRVKPTPIPYPSGRIKYRHYGRTLEKVIEQAMTLENDDKRDRLILIIANFMKMLYVNWNKDNVNDEVIIDQLKEMSGGELILPADTKLKQPPELHQRAATSSRKNNSRRGRSRGSNGGRNYRRN
jgi:uncharacterized protein DUF4290